LIVVGQVQKRQNRLKAAGVPIQDAMGKFMRHNSGQAAHQGRSVVAAGHQGTEHTALWANDY
jgi:hypothetical protein